MGERPTKHPALESQQELKESLEIGLRRRGDPLDGWVTYRDLDRAGLIDGRGVGRGAVIVRPGRSVAGDDGVSPIPPPDFGENDLTRPPAPENVRARGLSNTSIGVAWNPPGYNNHAYSEIFASFQPLWSVVAESFNPDAPVGPGNQTQFLMGRASDTSFLHSNLGATIPDIRISGEIVGFSRDPAIFVFLSGDLTGLFSVDDRVYLRSEETWNGNGAEGVIAGINFDVNNDRTIVALVGAPEFDDPPAGAELVAILDEDELDEALSPRKIYYWVRFVSTARVAGPVQSQEGIPGQVMLDSREIMNILTGRIRSSQLANDLLQPINFIRGPINELDENGNRKYPTIRDFILAQGDDILSEYDETLNEVILGYLSYEPQQVARYRVSTSASRPNAFYLYVDAPSSLFAVNQSVLFYSQSRQSELSEILSAPGRDVRLLIDKIYSNVNWNGKPYTRLRFQRVNRPPGDFELDGASVVVVPETGSYMPGIASAAAFVSHLSGQAGADRAWMQSLETLQAAFEVGTPNEYDESGILQIISTIAQRRLVEASDGGALAYIGDTLQIDFGSDENGDPRQIFLNEVGNQILLAGDSVNQSWMVRLQSNNEGVITAAGFGIGMETDIGTGESVSTFAVSADQFAIMGPGLKGRRLRNIRSWGGDIRAEIMDGEQFQLPALQQDFPIGQKVVIVSPPSGEQWSTSTKGRTLTVVSANWDSNLSRLWLRLSGGVPLESNSNFDVSQLRVAIYHEQSIPFIVDTATGTVGIRGRLIVDGMINAQELEVTELLRANEIWAQSITNFGLIRTRSLVGETIATPRFGGWAVKMTSPNLSFNNRIFEYSRWQDTTDQAPNPNLVDMNNLQDLYPQLEDSEPSDSAFWINAQGRVFVRASLQVGGNARILTLDPQNITTSRYFIQNDNEFPLMIYPFDRVGEAGQNWNNPEQQWNYTDDVRAAVRNNALFWVNRDGTAGFNTRNSAIFVGDTPMEPPSGFGYITVKTRLAEGQWTGRGRVLITATFAVANDQNTGGPNRLFGCTYALFIVPATWNPTVPPSGVVSRRPSENNGTGSVNLGSQQTAFLDRHARILRSVGSSGSDPGNAAFDSWQSANPSAKKIAEFFDNNSGGVTLSGAAHDIASGNYRVFIVIVERFLQDGSPISSATPGRTLPYNLSPCANQISTTPYDGPATEGAPPPAFDSGPSDWSLI